MLILQKVHTDIGVKGKIRTNLNLNIKSCSLTTSK